MQARARDSTSPAGSPTRAVWAARALGALAVAAALLAAAGVSGGSGFGESSWGESGSDAAADSPAWRGPHPVDATVPEVPILMYHHIGDWGAPHPSWVDWVVKPADFRAQLDWLVAHGYRTVTFEELVWAREHGGVLPEKPIVISFDDGWAEHAHWCSAELAPRGMRGVLFVFTGAVAPNRNGGGYISWEELRALVDEGHEVESHTVSHARLPQVPDEALARELAASRARISEMLGREASVLAYPYGDFDLRVAVAAARAGYRLAVRADADPAVGAAGRLSLPRIRMRYGEGVDALEARLRDGYCEHSRY